MVEIADGPLLFSGVPPSGTIVLAYHRPVLHIPRRDLVAARSDSLVLTFTIVQSDDPSAPVLFLTGGVGGPSLRMIVRRPAPGNTWDYGLTASAWGTLGAIEGTISASYAGSFDVVLASSAMSAWPSRCYYEIQLNNAGHGTSQILAHGMLHLSGGTAVTFAEIPLLTDGGELVLDDDAVVVDIV